MSERTLIHEEALAASARAQAAVAELAARRGNCAVCGRDYALTYEGLVRKHMTRARTGGKVFCDGGEKVPA